MEKPKRKSISSEIIRRRQKGNEAEEIYLSMSFFFDTDSFLDNNYWMRVQLVSLSEISKFCMCTNWLNLRKSWWTLSPLFTSNYTFSFAFFFFPSCSQGKQFEVELCTVEWTIETTCSLAFVFKHQWERTKRKTSWKRKIVSVLFINRSFPSSGKVLAIFLVSTQNYSLWTPRSCNQRVVT